MQPRTPFRVVAGAAIAASLFLAACAPAPQAGEPEPDPTKEPAYAAAVEQLANLNHQAEDLLKRGRRDEAAAAIAKS